MAYQTTKRLEHIGNTGPITTSSVVTETSFVRALTGSIIHEFLKPERHWYHSSIDQLALLSTLRKGWNGYSADSPTAQAIYNAFEILWILFEHEFRPDRIMASALGGVAFYFFSGDATREASIGSYNNGEIVTMRRVPGSPEVFVENVSISDQSLSDAIDQARIFVSR